MYQEIDAILGIAIKNRSPNQTIVLSSDHGAIPLEKEIWLNNLFHKKGWLEFKIDKNGDKLIDWKKSQVIFLQMSHVYINPKIRFIY
jgi:predicted AlkP superfamily pyrophosphatase or phosphodiesterase